jgi:type IV fimbrial biogenesis protein FimT
VLSQTQRGFSLIELMVVIAIMALLMLAVAPSIGPWIANARVRSVAEEIANGLRMAQSEALRRNRPVAFVLTNATPANNATPNANGKNWYVQALPLASSGTTTAEDKDYVQGGNYASQGGVTIAGTSSVLCFGSMGSVVAIGASDAVNVIGVACAAGAKTYTVSRTGSDRSLTVLVSAGGQVRMCDPAKTLSTTNPDGCYPA